MKVFAHSNKQIYRIVREKWKFLHFVLGNSIEESGQREEVCLASN